MELQEIQNIDGGRLLEYKTPIVGLRWFQTLIRRDTRGSFSEFRIPEVMGGLNIRQSNLSVSELGVIRGMHGENQDKFVTVAQGRAIGAWVDARKNSETFGIVTRLNLEQGWGVFIPEGVLNGFAVTEGPLIYAYMVSKTYNELDPEKQIAVNPLSSFPDFPNGLFPEIRHPLVSERDSRYAITWNDFRADLR